MNEPQPTVPTGNSERQHGKVPEGLELEQGAAPARARRPTSRMPRNSLFYERVVPLLLILLVVAMAALLVIILWGVLAGTYA